MVDISRLKNSVDHNFKLLRKFRSNRLTFIQQYVGHHYSNNATSERTPVNLIALAVGIYIRKLAARNPAAFITPKTNMSLLPYAENLQLGVNHTINEINLIKTLQDTVLDAFFGMGIVKQGICLGAKIELDGYTHDVGQPYVDNVSIDDYVFDMWAKRRDQMSFEGNVYRVPFDYAVESGIYDMAQLKLLEKHVRGKTVADRFKKSNESGGDYGSGSISREFNFNDEEFLDYIDLIDLWLPYENRFMTFPYLPNQGKWTAPLYDAPYHGPESGPYKVLGFGDVPDNILPNPPVSLWIDLNVYSNKLFRKIMRQTDRQKTILGVMRGNKKDGETIVNADDGEAVLLDFPDKCREYRFGGADNVGTAFFLQLKEMFSYFAGNLDSMGGLGIMSETASQDKLLNESANEQISSMRDKTIDFTTKIIKDLAWYLAYDPFIEIPLNKRIQGTDISVPIVLNSDMLEGTYLEYNYNIIPHSMQDDSPQAKMQKITGIFREFIAPMIPIIQGQGGILKVQQFIDMLSKLNNLPELNNIFMFADGEAIQPQPIGTPPVKSSHRTYERINRPGATMQGKNAAMIQTLLGSKVQPAEAAAMTRSSS